jgi:hypothetical protein
MTCPWCHKINLPVNLMKRHIKYCPSSPRPRGKVMAQRQQVQNTAAHIYGIDHDFSS